MSIIRSIVVLSAAVVSVSTSGCVRNYVAVPAPIPEPPARLGATVQSSLMMQEENGEASDFVVYEHEFVQGTCRLNPEGESHLRQIAARAAQVSFPIIVEHASAEISPDDPCYVACPTIDSQRRNAIAVALTMMGVANANARVVSGPALSPGLTAGEADRAYNQATSRSGGGAAGGAGGGSFAGGLGGGFF